MREHGELILQQTRALTHVVTEFLKFARPLELADEQVSLQPMIEQVLAEVSEVVPDVPDYVRGRIWRCLRRRRPAAPGDSEPGAQRRRGRRGQSRRRARDYPRRNRHSPEPCRASGFPSSDNGPGIPAEALTKIFMPFYTTKANGTGLGLAVVQKIVVQHGGTIEARNQPQGGAEFIVWLPFVREAVREIDSAAARI